jgi:V/A-type H+-transporting ATPase subunit K
MTMAIKTKFAIGITLLTAVLAALGSGLLWWAPQALAAEPAAGVALSGSAASWGMLAAALATGVAAAGAGYAVAVVGSAAIGTLAEKPELFGRLLIFVGLAEGIAIYGLIIAVLILNRLG